MKTIKDLHIGELIKKRLKEHKRSQSWLAHEIDYDDSHLRKMLKNKYIHNEILFKISLVLKEDFFAHYSEKLKIGKNIPDNQAKVSRKSGESFPTT
ncbi:MAG: hypothetical protein LBE36_07260 [Flavobacteriaceae bacterium]|jgi:hypothetical protein|nr:hypothetical protein [Flavobacteriaceae bacterium]